MNDTAANVVIVLMVVWVLASPFLSAWLALRLCRRNYDCPLRRENAAKEWTRSLEAQHNPVR